MVQYPQKWFKTLIFAKYAIVTDDAMIHPTVDTMQDKTNFAMVTPKMKI